MNYLEMDAKGKGPILRPLMLLLIFGVMAVGLAQGAPDELFQKIVSYDQWQSREALSVFENSLRNASPVQKSAAEACMVRVIESPKGTYDGKQYACRILRLIGTEASVPALANLLEDKKLSHMARLALQYMPSPQKRDYLFFTDSKVNRALREALDKTDGNLRVGVITTIAARGDVKSVGPLARLAKDQDPVTAAAAIAALGQIGGSKATRLLVGLRVPESLKAQRADAYLRCADKLLAAGKRPKALGLYRQAAAVGNSTPIRFAGYVGIIRTERDGALPTVQAMLNDENFAFSRLACKMVNTMPGEPVTRALAGTLPTLKPEVQTMLLAALTVRGDKAATAAVVKLVASPDEAVKVAAIKALAALGTSAELDLLIQTAVAGGASGDAAVESLGRIHGEGVSARLIQVSEQGDPAVRARVIAALALRHDQSSIPMLFKALGESGQQVRVAAAKALGALAREEDEQALVDLLVKSNRAADRQGLQQALVGLASRSTDKAAGAMPIITTLPVAGDDAKASLLALLSQFECPQSFETASGYLKDANLELKKASIRSLSEWPNPSPAKSLVQVAREEKDPVCKLLALRGLIRLAGLEGGTTPEARLVLYHEAFELSKSPEEKTMLLGGLSYMAQAEALKMAQACLNDPALSAEAQTSCVRIAARLGSADKVQAKAALAEVLKLAKDGPLRGDAQAAYDKLK